MASDRAQQPDASTDSANGKAPTSAGVSGGNIMQRGASDPRAIAQLRSHRRKRKAKKIQFAANEGSTVKGGVAEEQQGEVMGNPALIDKITDGAKGLETPEDESLSVALEGAGDVPLKAADVNEVAHATDRGHAGVRVPHGVHEGGNETEDEGAEAEEESEIPWVKLAMAPAILNAISEGKYSEAAIILGKTLGPVDVSKAVLYAVQKLGLKLAARPLEWLIERGAQANVLWSLMLWTFDGISAVQRAHAMGDEESHVRMYAKAFADSFLEGEGADGGRAGAVTAGQKEAVELGLRDGSKTAGQFGEMAPDIGRELLRRCGSEDAVKRLLMDALMKRAGLPPIGGR